MKRSKTMNFGPSSSVDPVIVRHFKQQVGRRP